MYPFYDEIHGYFDIRRYRVKGVAKILTSIIFCDVRYRTCPLCITRPFL